MVFSAGPGNPDETTALARRMAMDELLRALDRTSTSWLRDAM
jgi:hypothetical protein